MLDRSPALERLVLALHVVAVFAVWMSGIAWIGQLGLTVAILVIFCFRRSPGAAGAKTQQLVYSSQAGWTLEEQGSEPRPLNILPSSVVSPWLIVLHGRIGSKRHDWVIARDSLDSESFRCLRVYLRVLPLAPTETEGVSSVMAGNGRGPFG